MQGNWLATSSRPKQPARPPSWGSRAAPDSWHQLHVWKSCLISGECCAGLREVAVNLSLLCHADHWCMPWAILSPLIWALTRHIWCWWWCWRSNVLLCCAGGPVCPRPQAELMALHQCIGLQCGPCSLGGCAWICGKAQLYSATATKVCMHQQADMPGCLVSSALHLQVALLKGPRPCQQWLGPSAVSGLGAV